MDTSLATQLEQLGLARSQGSTNRAGDSLGQEDFLALMIAQFRNQDPFKPMQNGEFLGQLAQFGTVSGIQEMQASIAALSGSLVSDQTLQASGLIGREVLVPSTGAHFDGEGVSGAMVINSGVSNATVEIKDAAGTLVARIPVEGNGLVDFHWDGSTLDGKRAPAGEYSITASFTEGGETVQSEVLISARVDSVIVSGGRGPVLATQTLGNVSLADVFQIKA